MSQTELGRQVAAARARRGLSLRKAAEQIGISHVALYDIERGRDPRFSTGMRIQGWVIGSVEGLTPERAYWAGWNAACKAAAEALAELRDSPTDGA